MSEEIHGSLSSFNLWSSLKCSEKEENFELNKANSFEDLTQPWNIDFFSSSIDWPHSILENSDTNFQSVLPEDQSATKQCKKHMNFTEKLQDSFFQLDQTLSESSMDEIQILPRLNGSLSRNTNPITKLNKTGSRDSVLPIAKKIRIETPSLLPTFKVRKEKLGDRITALQQLVSPFGKTDTASVLHEAIEYIKSLHEQVNGLSNPYLQKTNQQNLESEKKNGDWAKKDLRSLGLCLVPISTTITVVRNELLPMDFWTQLWSMENYYSMRRER